MSSYEAKPLTAKELYDALMADSAIVNRDIAERLTGETIQQEEKPAAVTLVRKLAPQIALLSCGHTVRVNSGSAVGDSGSCPKCPAPQVRAVRP